MNQHLDIDGMEIKFPKNSPIGDIDISYKSDGAQSMTIKDFCIETLSHMEEQRYNGKFEIVIKLEAKDNYGSPGYDSGKSWQQIRKEVHRANAAKRKQNQG